MGEFATRHEGDLSQQPIIVNPSSGLLQQESYCGLSSRAYHIGEVNENFTLGP